MDLDELRNALSATMPDLVVRPGQPLPIFARREGQDVVVISAAEYARLIGLQGRGIRQTLGAALQASRTPPMGLSTIERDVEVADFLRDRFRGRMTIAALHAACLEAFGPDRTPSRSRIQTFRSRWREYR